MKIISISNHKGGVGKTTSCVNIGAALALKGKKVLLIDLDAQANLTQSLGIENEEDNIYTAIRGKTNIKPVEVSKNLFCVPSSLDLSGAEVELSSEAGREFILSELLKPLKKQYDYILIDCPPSLALLTINAFTASDAVLIPLQAQFLALKGVVKLTDILERVKARLNKKLTLAGIFITQYDKRKVLNKEVAETIRQRYKGKVFKTEIRENIALAEAPTAKIDIFRYAPRSNGAADYKALTAEVVKAV
jgi:chromosome partitioning protein